VSILLLYVLCRGDLKIASEFFDSVYPPVALNLFCLWSIRSHVAYLTRVAEAVQRIRLIERNLPSVIGRSNPWLKMKYFSSTADLFERIAQRRPETRKARLPNTLKIFREDCRYEPGELVKWFRDEAFGIARTF